MTLRHLPLHDGWTLTADGPVPVDLPAGGLPATVPGCVHTDLLAAGLIDDPYLDDNETRLGWTGRTDWTYRTTFDWAPDGHDHAALCFDGLDTVATVLLNGTEVGRTANQHRSYRFPVRPLLREGANTLVVRFTAPYTYAEELRERLGDRPGAYAEPYAFIRKMACNFGWDWGPTLVTSGIWRPVALETWSGPRIASVTLLPDLDEAGVPRLTAELELDHDGLGPLSGEVAVEGEAAAFTTTGDEHRVTVTLSVPRAEAWWPHSHGAQPLYAVTVRVGEDVRTLRTGFRSITLDEDAFRIAVNGEDVFVRGVNWIPEDCFPTRVTRERLSARLDQAVAAGVNLVRVWGGGLYESDDFYALCDEKGLLVWQDFPFACAAYPEEQPLWDEVAAEARENVVRLAPHPSLVLWCGNNENLEGHADWGWREELGERTWGHGYYHELLPSIVAATDPTRPYWPGSPYSGTEDLHPQDPAHGTIHVWDVWNRADYLAYADRVPRFVAEFGFQGPPAYATLRRAVGGPLTPDAPLLAHHQKAEDGNAKLLRGLGDHLPLPGDDFDDWHWLTQLNQARAVAFGIRHFRSHTPYCMGTIVWQLNDCWPVVSWAAVDGDGRRKPLWYALREVYADRLIVIRDDAAHLVNDAPEPWTGPLRLTRHALDGTALATHTETVTVAPRGVTRVPLPPSVAAPADPAAELLTARLGATRTTGFFDEDTRLALEPPRYDVTVTEHPDDAGPPSYRVEVTARTLLKDLSLFPDRLDPAAVADRMLVTLLPGETTVFMITGARLPNPDALGAHPVLRCVNDTVAKE